MTARQLKRHIRKIRTGRFWAIFLVILAAVMFGFSFWMTETYYDIWLAPDKTRPAAEQIESIERAIRLHPLEQEGYNKILDIHLIDGVLDEDEHAHFQELLDEQQERINRKCDVFTPLYRRLAFVYLANYHEDAQTRLKMAQNYLEVVQPFAGATQLEATAINAYLEISNYYTEYVWLEGSLRKPAGGEVNDILRRMVAMMDTMQHASDADRLAYACLVADLVSEHGDMWLNLVEYSKIAEVAATLEAQLSRKVTDPAAFRLKKELQAWCQQEQPWEVHRDAYISN